MPRAQYDHRVILAVPPAGVWEALQEPETWANIGPVHEVWDAHFEDGVLCGYRWSARAGPRTIEGTAVTRQARAPDLMVIDLDAGEVKGMITTELEPEAGGTAMEVQVSLEAGGLLASLFWGPLTAVIESGLPQQVEDLAKAIDSGRSAR